MLVLAKYHDPEKDSTVRLLAAVMFADIAGYTALMQDDEERAIRLRKRQRLVLEETLAGFGGEVRQYYGDGALCVFRSAVNASRCAVALQRQFRQEPRVPVRIGMHMGDIVSDSEGIYGDAVNIASRIESMAAPGEVFVSGKMYDEIKNHKSLAAISVGTFELKHVAQPMEIYAVHVSDSADSWGCAGGWSPWRVPGPVRSGSTRSSIPAGPATPLRPQTAPFLPAAGRYG